MQTSPPALSLLDHFFLCFLVFFSCCCKHVRLYFSLHPFTCVNVVSAEGEEEKKASYRLMTVSFTCSLFFFLLLIAPLAFYSSFPVPLFSQLSSWQLYH